MTLEPRRLRLLPVALVLVLLLPALAHAQADSFRTRIGLSGGVTIPLDSEGYFSDPGSVWQGQIGVGDDPSVVSIVVGYASFGGHLFEQRTSSVTQFELRSEWLLRPNRKMSPVGQFGVGLYRVIDPSEGERRFGFRGAGGMRWMPDWQTAVGLIASVNVIVDADHEPTRWLALGVEVLRWMD